MHEETVQDADHYEQYCVTEALRGTKAIFRTSISAQALYEVRQRLEAVKAEQHRQGSAMLMVVRDQAQGFYTGFSEYHGSTATLSRTCKFNKDVMSRIVSFSIDRARRQWFNQPIDRVTLVYKHHLFDGIMDTWAAEWSQKHGVEIKFVQPDTTNRNLLAFGITGRHLMITGNEYADIMQVFLLKMFGGETQETSFAENIYLRPDLHQLSEYQTVHGSADDIEGKGIVNPTATIRAAVAILEKNGCAGLEQAAKTAISLLASRRISTPDQGGSLGTEAIVDAFLSTVRQLLQQSRQQAQDPSTPSASSPLERLRLTQNHLGNR